MLSYQQIENKRKAINYWKNFEKNIIIDFNDFVIVERKNRWCSIVHFCPDFIEEWWHVISGNKICNRCGKEIPKNILIIYKLKKLGQKIK